jgi:hypothetical protein
MIGSLPFAAKSPIRNRAAREAAAGLTVSPISA